MFMESFENSSKQQQRRKSRQEAMRRMQEAADLAGNDDEGGKGKGKGGAKAAQGGNKSSSSTAGSAMVDDKSNDGGRGDDKDNTIATSARVNDESGQPKRDDNSNTKDNDADNNNGDYFDDENKKIYYHHTNASDCMSVTSASNFLNETRLQFELEHNLPGGSSSPNNNMAMSPTTSSLSKVKLDTKAARQFLWDDSSITTAGYSSNLHDIKNMRGGATAGSGNNGVGAKGGRTWSGGIAGARARRWSAMNGNNNDDGGNNSAAGAGASGGVENGNVSGRLWSALPLFGGGHAVPMTDADRGRCLSGRRRSNGRDDKGERLLNLASDRLASRRKNNDQYAPSSLAEDDDDGDHDIEMDDDENSVDSFMGDMMSESNQVLLDDQGNLDVERPGNNDNYDDDLHTRRMMNSYRRALKRPSVMLACACLAAVILVATVGSVYSKVLLGMGSKGVGGEGGNGGYLEGYDKWLNDTMAAVGREDDWTNSVNGGGGGSAMTTTTKPLDGKRLDHIRYILISSNITVPPTLFDTQSAQYAALVWLTRDDPLQMDPESVYLPQRYALTTLWFATTKSGYDWHAVPDGYTKAKPMVNGNMIENNGVHHHRNRRDRNRERRVQVEDQVQEDHPNGGEWFRHEGWLSGDGICGWHGVSCHPREDENEHNPKNDGDVSRVELRSNNLRGLFPRELRTALPYLKVLDLSDNGMAGKVGDILGKDGDNNSVAPAWHGGLEILNLTSNDIAGSLTSELGSLASLKELDLSNNLLEGSIPHTIGELRDMKHLDLSGNSLHGTIPYQFGNMKSLGMLDLSWNRLVGPVPHEFSELQTLVTLDVGHNDLGGPLMSELGHVTYLTVLRLNHNHFSGEIPTELGALVHLDELRLDNNDFKGTLPPEMSNLEGLDYLDVSNNHFEGEFPPEWTEMAGLQRLDVSSNKLRGEIPVFIDGMINLRSLNVAHNDFSSSIPSELGSLYKLEYLYLNDNELEGDVPPELGELTNLKKMALHNNYLTGNIHEPICKLADELFLIQLSADCGGETPEVSCDCCVCHDHEPIVHLNAGPGP